MKEALTRATSSKPTLVVCLSAYHHFGVASPGPWGENLLYINVSACSMRGELPKLPASIIAADASMNNGMTGDMGEHDRC